MTSIKDFISHINQEPFVMGEGKKEFSLSGLDSAKGIMSHYSGMEDFAKNASLEEKMKISAYLNTGKWQDTVINLAKIDDKTTRSWGDVALRDYVGMDTRGLISVDLGIGANINLFAVEKRIDKDLQNWLNKGSVGGSEFKAGKVFQHMQSYFSAAKAIPKASAKEPWEATTRLLTYDDIKYIPYTDIINFMPAWRMTKTDYQSIPRKKGLGIQKRDGWLWAHTHKNQVKQALAEGKPVPAEVLADYPELSRKAEKKVGTMSKLPSEMSDTEFVTYYYTEAAKRQRDAANKGAENIKLTGKGSMYGYDRYKYKESFLEKASLFEKYAREPERHINDTSVVNARKLLITPTPTPVTKAIAKLPKTCKITKRHTDGDITMKCPGGKSYVITTNGDMFKEIKKQVGKRIK